MTRDGDPIVFDLNCHSGGLHVTVMPVQNARVTLRDNNAASGVTNTSTRDNLRCAGVPPRKVSSGLRAADRCSIWLQETEGIAAGVHSP
jgi:hypothetical protein